MHVAQRGDYSEFDDDLVLDCQGLVKNHDSPLLDDAERGLSHFVGKGVLVDGFNEPMTERIGNPERTADDRPVTGCNNRASPSSICIPLIRLKAWSWHPYRRLTGRVPPDFASRAFSA